MSWQGTNWDIRSPYVLLAWSRLLHHEFKRQPKLSTWDEEIVWNMKFLDIIWHGYCLILWLCSHLLKFGPVLRICCQDRVPLRNHKNFTQFNRSSIQATNFPTQELYPWNPVNLCVPTLNVSACLCAKHMTDPPESGSFGSSLAVLRSRSPAWRWAHLSTATRRHKTRSYKSPERLVIIASGFKY